MLPLGPGLTVGLLEDAGQDCPHGTDLQVLRPPIQRRRLAALKWVAPMQQRVAHLILRNTEKDWKMGHVLTSLRHLSTPHPKPAVGLPAVR